jgi:hypothetical protein
MPHILQNMEFDRPKRAKRLAIAGTVCLLMIYHWLSQLRRPISTIAVKRTVIIYSGPTSIHDTDGKNFMYLKNLDYFLQHGVSCSSVGVEVDYIIVLTRDVADQYSSTDGLITKKKQECKDEMTTLRARAIGIPFHESFIDVMIRQNRCYDMESIRIVSQQRDLQKEYDNLVFVNCGMAGPKFGPNSPVPSGTHWSQLFTAPLTDSVRMVGLSINGCVKHQCRPHVQSFLYAISTQTLQLLLSEKRIYDCGDETSRIFVINLYEIGMSKTLINQGYSIASAYLNNEELGKSLIVNQTNLHLATNDLWVEDSLRNATMTIDQSSLKRSFGGGIGTKDILPWDYYMFFKVSRYVLNTGHCFN